MAWAWVTLIIGGLFEMAWAIMLRYTEAWTKLVPSIITLFCMFSSMTFLSWSLLSLPTGTAYAVWTGTATAGLAIVGVIFFGEQFTVIRMFSIAAIIGGIIGLRLSS